MEFPDLGENCSEETCNKLDFLPMKCDACGKIFCNEHFHYLQHGCESGKERNVQVPACPLCNAPVPGTRGEAPDVAVSAHIDNYCQADPAKLRRNKVFTNRCSHKGCKGKEMVPLLCTECDLNFCFKHRHNSDHNCEGKLGAKRRQAAEAAMARAKFNSKIMQQSSYPNQAEPNRSNVFTEVQGQMSEDEALARALALSMQDEDSSPSPNTSNSRNPIRGQASRQRVGGEHGSSKCIMS